MGEIPVLIVTYECHFVVVVVLLKQESGIMEVIQAVHEVCSKYNMAAVETKYHLYQIAYSGKLLGYSNTKRDRS